DYYCSSYAISSTWVF
nr:immunoglobulin light chain junction region [Macaca mulatta]MOW27628.1 immunoglobulin light chain junction region [Macaca mulatta]MOW27668.1 immunoglobulin light chain junction region [Macaca mulatta]MOW27877.1 immunoglobulin light chain junction region [Macaca mulatta]MOW30240.1 immunoglobulin light chain junction region [Macaca mulatta]